MTEKISSRSLRYSLAGHLIFFSIVNFSFGLKISKPRHTGIFFLGALLRAADVRAPLPVDASLSPSLAVSSGTWALPLPDRIIFKSRDYCVKPHAKAYFQADKTVTGEGGALPVFLPRRKDSVVMFYPQLPYHFLLYFADRQEAHLEFEFRISSYEQTSSVAIKRKISSGNLEVDLLSMRYLNHYLSMQLGRFPLNEWQAVKIDFRPKNN